MKAAAKRHLDLLHKLPCAVTFRLTGQLVYRDIVVHHPESVRDEWTDFSGIPMQDWRHKQLHQLSRRGFEALTKLSELDLLATTMFLIQNDFHKDEVQRQLLAPRYLDIGA